MLYISTFDFCLKGSYEEPIDDGCPYMGTYSQDVTVHIPKNTGIEIAENGKVKSVDIATSFGVSMYEGSLRIEEKVFPQHKDKVKPISEEEYDKIKEKKGRKKALLKEIINEHEKLELIELDYDALQDMVEDSQKPDKILSQEEYETVTKALWQNAYEYVCQKAVVTSLSASYRHLANY